MMEFPRARLLMIAILAVFLPLGALAQTSEPAKKRVDAAPAHPIAKQMTQTDVDAWLDGMMPSLLQGRDLAGAVIVVVKDGQVLTQRGYGYADYAKKIPVDPANTLFRPGSISKLFVWTSVMQLVEQGKIDLDADINTYLDFKVIGRGGKKITMRHLMTHRGGFEEIAKNLFTDNPRRNLTNEQRMKASIPATIFDPGAVPAYSNYGTSLAGYIVQRVSGMPFEDYVEKAIFSPLGMTQSTFRQPLPKKFLSDISKGYLAGSGPAQPFEYISIAPAGSLSSTAADMARFMIAHLQQGQLGGAQILRTETALAMHNTATPTIPGLNNMLLGFYETNMNGRRIISHGGDTILFHSDLHLFVNDGIGLFVSFNSTGVESAAPDPRSVILKNFADRYFPVTSSVTEADNRNAIRDANLVAGSYSLSRRTESNFLALPNLFLTVDINALKDGSIEFSTRSGPQRYTYVGPMLWRGVKDGELFGAKMVDGVVTQIGLNPAAGITVGERVPIWRSDTFTVPAVVGALIVYMFMALSWPAAAIARRYYKVPAPRTGATAFTFTSRGILICGTFALLCLWGYVMIQVSELSYVPDGLIIALQIASAVIGLASLVIGFWRLKLSFETGSGWTIKIGAIAFLLASIIIVWMAWMGRIYMITPNY